MPLDNCQAPTQTTPNKKNYQLNYTTNSITDKTDHCWAYILENLGISPSYLKNKHGPCPNCGGKDRFRFDNKNGKGTFICNQCGAGNGFRLLELCYGWDFPEACNKITELLDMFPMHQEKCIRANKVEHISQPLKRIIKANFPTMENDTNERLRKYLTVLWQQAKPIAKGDFVDRYLISRRIVLNEFPSVLRYHPNLPYYDDEQKFIGYFPAMLALITDHHGKGVSIHRTYLGNGCKAAVSKQKKLTSSIFPGASSGATIKLYEAESILILAEGVETAFALYVATQIPTWATVSAGGMQKAILPSNVKEVIIAVDNDKSLRGQIAANKLAQRLLNEGIRVKRVIPPQVGNDFADVLMEDE